MSKLPDNVHEDSTLRNRARVFGSRNDAGIALAQLLLDYRDTDAAILGIPAGGVPVAAAAAQQLSLPLDFLTVSKITLPWNTEAGYGAVAFDGTWQLNEQLVRQAGLDAETVHEGIASTKEKVEQRVRKFRKLMPAHQIKHKIAIVVDDGLASGFTMCVAVAALRNQEAKSVIVAVPTGHLNAITRLAGDVDEIYCVNIRSGMYFAVAEAYTQWSDVSEDEVTSILSGFLLDQRQDQLHTTKNVRAE